MKKLDNDTVMKIYYFSGTAAEIQEKFGCSLRVARRIKFGQTYGDVTQYLDDPGEIRLHSLTWDDVCEIRASDQPASYFCKKYGITKETVYNIRNEKTRKYQ